jgi:hypothetical protein
MHFIFYSLKMAEKVLLPLVESNPLLGAAAIGTYGAYELGRYLSGSEAARPRNRFRDTQGLHPVVGQHYISALERREEVRQRQISEAERVAATRAAQESARSSEQLIPQSPEFTGSHPTHIAQPVSNIRSRVAARGDRLQGRIQRAPPRQPVSAAEEIRGRPLRRPVTITTRNGRKIRLGAGIAGSGLIGGLAASGVLTGGATSVPQTGNPVLPVNPAGNSPGFGLPAASPPTSGIQYPQGLPGHALPATFRIPPFPQPIDYQPFVAATRYKASQEINNISAPTSLVESVA